MTTGQACDVSVVIPVFNSAATLERAVRSVLAQTLATLELIIVDDGSADGSLAIAQGLALADVRVTVVALPRNGGKARAMNHAASIARGTWIAVLDADDCYLPTRLATLVEAGTSRQVDLVADNQLHSDDATGLIHRQAFAAPDAGRAVGLADFIAHARPTADFDFGILKPMIRRDFLIRHGLAYHPEARLAEDFYFLMEFFAAGGRGWLVHEPLYEWTLPFSPTARRWTGTGSGAWRYDYRNALRVNQDFQARPAIAGRPELAELLRRRAREYAIMIPYLDAQRILAEEGNPVRALAIIAFHPVTWPLLIKRVVGRIGRALPRLSHAVPVARA
jgi:succinoglycan biosynthesis protein ExoO